MASLVLGAVGKYVGDSLVPGIGGRLVVARARLHPRPNGRLMRPEHVDTIRRELVADLAARLDQAALGADAREVVVAELRALLDVILVRLDYFGYERDPRCVSAAAEFALTSMWPLVLTRLAPLCAIAAVLDRGFHRMTRCRVCCTPARVSAAIAAVASIKVMRDGCRRCSTRGYAGDRRFFLQAGIRLFGV